MDHRELFDLRANYNDKRILLCFNGPFSQGLIEEIGNALRRYMQAEAEERSSAMDVFAVYIEIAQNIQRYSAAQGYNEADASATVVIARDDLGHYVISAGNVVENADGAALQERISHLAGMDRAQLKVAYREQLRKPREDESSGAGLGLIDIARKAFEPMTCSVRSDESGQRSFFSLRVVI